MTKKEDAAVRLWRKVEKTPTCWLWQGAITPYGYGLIWAGGASRRVHRISYESEVGPIPEGLVLDHLCRVRHCVNPSHLEPVTIKENVLRGYGTGAQCARRSHCKNGHEYTPENTRISKSRRGTPYRRCLTCHRARTLATMTRLRQAKRNASNV